MAISWFQVCKKAIDMFLHRDLYCYIYGAKGVLMSSEQRVWDFINAYPEHYKKFNKNELNEIVKNSVGRTAFDCSGFVDYVTGETGYSIEIYEKRTKETTLTDGLAGQFLFTTWGKGISSGSRHIGLDVGLGFSCHTGWESTNENIRKNRHSIVMRKITEDAWEHSFQTAAVNYNGAYGTDPNGKPKDVIVSPVPLIGFGKIVNCDAANLRIGAGKAYALHNIDRNDGLGVRHVLYRGEEFGIVGRQGNWSQIYIPYDSKTYWLPFVCNDYVETIK